MLQECKKCRVEKPLKDFSPDKRLKIGVQGTCRECKKEEYNNFRKTKRGLTVVIYFNQKTHSKTKGYPTPAYTLEEFYNWLVNQPQFEKLYINWIESNYNKDSIPSVDRKNDYDFYNFKNIQLVTWKENNEKGASDRKEGKNKKKHKSVNQYNLKGEFINSFESIKEAQKETKATDISSCCHGKIKTSGGFIWKFKN